MAKVTKIEAVAKLNPMKKIKVAAYARVSTDSEEQLLSLETQRAHYEEYISTHPDWEFAGVYYDEGISGTKIKRRDALQDLLDACERDQIDRVITKSISRFARNTPECLEMVRKLSKLNVSIYFEKENIDTEQMSSELMLSILSSIAESESRSISENSKWSIKNRFENGTFIISCPPYGYQNVEGKMVIVPEEAEIVKEIFHLALNGSGCHVIAKILNDRGVPSKKGASWHASTVIGILKNEKYTGDAILQKTFTDEDFNRHNNYGEKNMYLIKDHHEPIVSHEDFETVAAAIERRGIEKGNDFEDTLKYQNRYPLSGRIICGDCGATFKRRTYKKQDGKVIQWACNTHLVDKETYGMKFIYDEDIKIAFLRMLAKLQVGYRQVLRPFINALRGYDSKDRLHQVMELEKSIERNEEQQRVLIDLMAVGYLEPEVYHAERRDLEAQMDELQQEKQQISSSITGDLRHVNEAEKLLKEVSKKNTYTIFDGDLFLELVDTITVIDRETVTFNLKCGLRLRERLV